LQSSGCYSVQSQNQLERCASTYCQDVLTSCFEPAITEPEPEPTPDPGQVEPTPVDPQPVDPTTPDEPGEPGPTPDTPYEPDPMPADDMDPDTDPADEGLDQGQTTTINARNVQDGCSATPGPASGSPAALVAFMLLGLAGLAARRRRGLIAARSSRPRP
jgi:MYXO-CTERM domain-containing protein